MAEVGTRKLAAVMFTDIAGYTAMVQKDEKTGLANVSIHRKHLEAFTAQYQGQVISFYGDGSLSIYESVIDAVRCAMAMQEEYIREKVPVRVGIHLGDFVIRDGSIFGDGVNIASRIQAEGIPGAILISEKVKNELHNHTEIHTLFLGEYELKNVQKPQLVYAITNPGLTVPAKKPRKVFSRKNLVKYAVSIVAVTLSIGYFVFDHFAGKSATTFQQERIAIPAFEDFTMTPSLMPIAQMAAHWITNGLIESVEASVVSYESAMQNNQFVTASAGTSFAKRTGAVNIVKGAYYLTGAKKDSLLFSAVIQNLITGEVLPVKLANVICSINDPMKGIEGISSEIKGYWKSKSDKVLTPPNYEAYKAYIQAKNVWNDGTDEAEKYLNEAIAKDRNFLDAYILMLDLFYNEGRHQDAKDTLAVIRKRFTDLSPRQENYIRYHEADVDGHRQEAFHYFTKEYEIDPKNLFVNSSGIVMALEYLNDPELALQFFAAIDEDSLDLAACEYCRARLFEGAEAYLLSGKPAQAVRLLNKLSNDPHAAAEYMRAIEVYMAVEDTAMVNRIIEKARADSALSDTYNYKYLCFVAARQAQLHGQNALRDRYGLKALSYSEPDSNRKHAMCLDLMQRYPEALAVYQKLLKKNQQKISKEKDQASSAYQSLLREERRLYAELGVLYAKTKQDAKAQDMIREVERRKKPFDYGDTPYYIGRIYAQLGNPAEAIRYLTQSLDEGKKFLNSSSFYGDPELLILQDDPAYKALLRRGVKK